MTEPRFPPNILCQARQPGWAHQTVHNNICTFCGKPVQLTIYNGYQVWETLEIVHEEQDPW